MRPRLRFAAIAIATVAGALAGCGDGAGPDGFDDDKLRQQFALVPLGVVPQPPDGPASAERIELGRLLFFDPILSGEKDVSCGTCHHPAFAFADGRQFSAGVSGVGLGPARLLSVSAVSGQPIGLTPRNSPTVLNAAYSADSLGRSSHLGLQFWDGRAAGLEEQARGPITSRAEMAGDAYPPEEAHDSIVARLREIEAYIQRFRAGFPVEAASLPGSEVISMDTYGRALAAYQRALVTRQSAFDRYAAGDDGALTGQQKQGLELFFTTARCGECHSGPMFSDYSFRVIGVPQAGSGGAVVSGDDVGREEHSGRLEDRHAFRTPSLRNVELTAPYMHDGVFATLEEVVRFYDAGALPRHDAIGGAALDSLVASGIGMSDAQVAAVVAFLKALTDPGTGLAPQLRTVPAAVPSGLTPVFGVRSP